MTISYNWLKQYINIQVSAEKLAELLTNTGLEVEGVKKIESIPGGLEGLVIGEVKTCEQHPNADRLRVTTVDVGQDEVVNIVCGAPNVAAGQKVVVALPGTVLYPTDGESFKIKKGKIRGEVSNGMICAEDEIGLGKGHDGILVLEADAQVGLPAKSYFDLEEDYEIEIGLTPNRADAASHIGVARDIIALKSVMPELADVELSWPDVSGFEVQNQNLPISIEVVNPEACPRYTGVTISGLKVQDSPEWLQVRLRSIGLSPINNVVDVTNFVLHEVGLPLHAFDAAKITSGKVVVKTLADGTPFKTLDGQDRKLNEKDLMICNGDEPMCIAGVFGGAESGVSESTTSVFLESAYFNPVSVRKTAKRHALNTDASFRFERGVDPEKTIYALKRAALLIQEVAGGEISSDIQEFYPEAFQPFAVDLNPNKVHVLAGFDIPKETMKAILLGLEIEVNEASDDLWHLTVPAYRVDVQREADIIEDILRIYGFDNIPFPKKMAISLSSKTGVDKEQVLNRVADFLTAQGYLEGMSNSQTKQDYYEKYDGFDPEKSVTMLNPLSQEYTVMRQTFLFDSLEAVLYNQNRQQSDIKLFEFGKTYFKHTNGTAEQSGLAITLCGKMHAESWIQSQLKADFYQLKGLVTSVLDFAGINTKSLQYSEDVYAFYQEGLKIKLGKKQLAEFGLISQQYLKDFDIKQPVYFAEINWDNLLMMLGKSGVKHQSVSKFPKVRRDLALLVKKDIRFADIEQIAIKTDKKILNEVNLFDVYEGKNLEEGTKSYAVSFIFQDTEKTLTDKHIDKVMDALLKQFENQLSAKLRS